MYRSHNCINVLNITDLKYVTTEINLLNLKKKHNFKAHI